MVLCEFNGPVRDALRRAHVAYDADQGSNQGSNEGSNEGSKEEGASDEDDACPMFVSLTDAVARARRLARDAEEATPREVVVKLDGERSGAARLSEDGAMTAVSADDL